MPEYVHCLPEVKTSQFICIYLVKCEFLVVSNVCCVDADGCFKIKPACSVKGCIKSVGDVCGRFSAAKVCRVFYIIVNEACCVYELYKRCKGISLLICEGFIPVKFFLVLIAKNKIFAILRAHGLVEGQEGFATTDG